MDYQGKTALITGASSGIGAEFARQLAARGMNLVLVARSQDKLMELAEDIRKTHEVTIKVLVADLSNPDEAADLAERTKAAKLEVDLLINNAGFGTHGRFSKQSSMQERREVLVNALAPLETIHAFLPGMIAHGGGTIVNMASA